MSGGARHWLLSSRNELTQLKHVPGKSIQIEQSEGRDWDSMWTLNQESYRDEAETVCHNCYVGGSRP